MKVIYMFRHQKAGIVTTHAFTTKPTDEQLAPLVAECARRHGPGGWGLVHELQLLERDEVPQIEVPSGPRSTMEMTASGTGSVEPKAGK